MKVVVSRPYRAPHANLYVGQTERISNKDISNIFDIRPASWSNGQSLTTNHEVPDSIPGSIVGIFPKGEDSRGDHGLGTLVEFRFMDPPGTTSSYITTHIIGTT